jgi:hypothetical protein
MVGSVIGVDMVASVGLGGSGEGCAVGVAVIICVAVTASVGPGGSGVGCVVAVGWCSAVVVLASGCQNPVKLRSNRTPTASATIASNAAAMIATRSRCGM